MAGQTGSNGNKGGNSVKAAPTPAKRRRYNTTDFTFGGEAAPF